MWTKIELINMAKKQGTNDVRDFIYFITHNKELTRKQQAKRDRLFTRDCVSSTEECGYKEKASSNNKKVGNMDLQYNPKNTASFLALFNSPKGFKFLTHDFDPDSTVDFKKFMQQTLEVFKDETKKSPIPKSLYALMKTLLEGTDKEWVDYNGTKHKFTYNSPKLREWVDINNGLHPLNDENFAKEIHTFRKTIRLVKPGLQDMVNELSSNFHSLDIESQGLDKADFYTYVRMLKNGIKRILEDMSRYAGRCPKVKIKYNRIFGDEYNVRIITITQLGSFSTSLEDALQKYRNGGGAFNEIRKCFDGYCNWSVETKWDDKPLRWNVLNDAGAEEIEDIAGESVEGFTHTLTYYSK